MPAVQQNGHALQHASEEMKNKKTVNKMKPLETVIGRSRQKAVKMTEIDDGDAGEAHDEVRGAEARAAAVLPRPEREGERPLFTRPAPVAERRAGRLQPQGLQHAAARTRHGHAGVDQGRSRLR